MHPGGGGDTNVDLQLDAGETVSGRTVEQKRQAPVPYAEIVFMPQLGGGFRADRDAPEAERVSGHSDARGEFHIGGLSRGFWMVEALAPGRAPTRLRDVIVPHQDLRIDMESAATIEGFVLRDGKPVANAEVTVVGRADPVVVRSGPEGGYAAEVSPGTHHVFAQLGAESGSAKAPVVVASGATAKRVDITLGPSASIAGKVRSSAGPVEGATVEATPHRANGSAARAVTKPEGDYEVQGLPPGIYDVAVTAPGGGNDEIRGITVRSGERFPLDVLLPDRSAVEGIVTDSSGSPVGGVIVMVADRGGFRGGGGPPGFGGGGSGSGTITDGSGHYRVEGLSPGRVIVSARRDASSPPSTQIVAMAEGQTVHADLTLVDGGLITGFVRDTQGNPVPGANVLIVNPLGQPPTQADGSGMYLLPLQPGTYGLSALPRGAGMGMRFTGPPQILATVRIAVGQHVDQDIVLPGDPRPFVSGQVLEPDSTPSPDAVVRVSGNGTSSTQMTTADGSGSFSVQVSPDVPTEVNARNGGRIGSATIGVGDATVVVQLQAAASLNGQLIGDPPPDTFSVVTVTPGTAIPWAGGNNDQQFSGSTFQIGDVVPGEVSVRVKTNDGRIGNGKTTLASGQTGNIAITLSPAATVTGRAVDATTQQPLTRGRVSVDGMGGRGGIGPGGQFSRTVSVGQHQLQISAPGYQPASRTFTATADPPTVDLGDIALIPGNGPPDAGALAPGSR
jgi:hypothetical protein